MRRLCILLSLLTALTLASCAPKPPPSASLVLTAMQEAMGDSGQPLPDGVIRLTAAPADSPNHLTETFFSALYGEAARGLLGSGVSSPPGETAQTEGISPNGEAYAGGEIPPIGDCAMFLSLAAYPCELAVFRVSDVQTAGTVERLCRGRLDTLIRGYKDSPWAEIPLRGRVETKGGFVILVVAEDPDPAVEAALRVIGG